MSGSKVYNLLKLEAVLHDSNLEPADFETAITASGFGKFNLLLYIISIAAGWASVFETTTMSYVFPAAECDLQLTLSDKGLLNAVTYTGMISSAFLWGFLCDILGRKKLLVYGFILDGIFFFIAAFSQNFSILMTAKFLGGFIINGPFAALATYLSEFHNAEHRARVQMILGAILSTGNLVLPLLALGILPLRTTWKLGRYFALHSWNFYLLVCALPSLVAGVAFIFLPESPKFLMTIGRNEKALEVFKRVYAMNTGKPAQTFPELIQESNMKKNEKVATSNRTRIHAFREGWQQIRPLFFPPHITKMILVVIMQGFTMMGLNTLRLWLPQIFQAINDYQYYNNQSADLCDMLEVFQHKNASLNLTTECFVNYNNTQVYTNAMIVSFTCTIGYITAGTLINTVGKKKLLCK
ncbi:hypothetical protein NQ317_019404 [Molorchus minor]|uniref:Major facilitator superfamily (MFS) profile domain-containing protein n=1 Tax=Molorchus minor TaxID=1323400 RepID=A0ABQ9JII7_9CUCU|nr:hypothetical protein NQ317_019404 [Molorchus minor]